MSKDSSRNETASQPRYLYGVLENGTITEVPITRITPKRVYFECYPGHPEIEDYFNREELERDGKAYIRAPGSAARVGEILYSSKPARTLAVCEPVPDSGRNDDGGPVGQLWQRLTRADWSSNAAAYTTATDARGIITMTGMTIAAFAAECKIRRISGFGSQASVSRRLRWAELHDELWDAEILPRETFISEAASRPLFDGKLTTADRLKLLAELFGPHLADEQKEQLAAEINEALMREHLARQGHGSERAASAPRELIPEKVIAKLLAQGVTADEIGKIARDLEDSARNATA